jgi:hypothetical protein
MTMTTTTTTVPDALRQIAGHLPDDAWIQISIQPPLTADSTSDQARAGWVATIARALGLTPDISQMPSGTWHYTADGRVGPVRVSVLTSLSGPDLDPQARRERLACELAALDARIAAGSARTQVPA